MIAPEIVQFVESGISVLVGTRDAALRPEGIRAGGAVADGPSGEITLFLPVATSARTIENLRQNGRIAATFTRAIDHRAIQLKGQVVEIRSAVEPERERIDRYLEALSLDWGFVGVPRKATRAMNCWPAYAVRFRVESTFEQTPGPEAGQRISAKEPPPLAYRGAK